MESDCSDGSHTMEEKMHTTIDEYPQSNSNFPTSISTSYQNRPKQRWYKSWFAYEKLLVQYFKLLMEWFKLEFYIQHHIYPHNLIHGRGIHIRRKSIRKAPLSKRKSYARQVVQQQFNSLCDQISSYNTETTIARRSTIAIPVHLKSEWGIQLYGKLREIQNDTKQQLLERQTLQHFKLHDKFYFNLDHFIYSGIDIQFIVKSFWLKGNDNDSINNQPNNNIKNDTKIEVNSEKDKTEQELQHDQPDLNPTTTTTTNNDTTFDSSSDGDVLIGMTDTPQDPTDVTTHNNQTTSVISPIQATQPTSVHSANINNNNNKTSNKIINVKTNNPRGSPGAANTDTQQHNNLSAPQNPPPQHPTYTKQEIAIIRRDTITMVGAFVPEMKHTIKHMPIPQLLALHQRWTFNHEPVVIDGVSLSRKSKELLSLGPQHIPVPRHPPIYEFNLKIQSFINWVRGRKTYGFQPDTRKFKEPVKQLKITDPLNDHPEVELFLKLVLRDLYNVELYNQRKGQRQYKKWVWNIIFSLRYNFNICITIQDKGGKFVVLPQISYDRKWTTNARITGMQLVNRTELDIMRDIDNKIIDVCNKYKLNDIEETTDLYKYLTWFQHDKAWKELKISPARASTAYGLLKDHKKVIPIPLRIITSIFGSATHRAAIVLQYYLSKLELFYCKHVVRGSDEVLHQLQMINFQDPSILANCKSIPLDVDKMYPNLDRPKGVRRIRKLLNKFKKRNPIDTNDWPATGFIIELLVICLNNSYVNMMERFTYKQRVHQWVLISHQIMPIWKC